MEFKKINLLSLTHFLQLQKLAIYAWDKYSQMSTFTLTIENSCVKCLEMQDIGWGMNSIIVTGITVNVIQYIYQEIQLYKIEFIIQNHTLFKIIDLHLNIINCFILSQKTLRIFILYVANFHNKTMNKSFNYKICYSRF